MAAIDVVVVAQLGGGFQELGVGVAHDAFVALTGFFAKGGIYAGY